MTLELSNKLIVLCDTVPDKLRRISDTDFSNKPFPDKWSKKELVGHLIDSAANNHQRFVRTQFETPAIFYEQDLWVSVQQYQKENIENLISLWEHYNRHLAHIIKNVPDNYLAKTTTGRDGKAYTLLFIIEDYISHLEHHLKQIFS